MISQLDGLKSDLIRFQQQQSKTSTFSPVKHEVNTKPSKKLKLLSSKSAIIHPTAIWDNHKLTIIFESVSEDENKSVGVKQNKLAQIIQQESPFIRMKQRTGLIKHRKSQSVSVKQLDNQTTKIKTKYNCNLSTPSPYPCASKLVLKNDFFLLSQ